ncbi:DUF4349 domain-containing protein [Streptomyces sp. NPDC002742]|uniref:DUF4349 domain-containing protein n=1 Tax=Streptomyces sp. NPDC002742 TaxID=3364663 RepID=UPI0036BB8D81
MLERERSAGRPARSVPPVPSLSPTSPVRPVRTVRTARTARVLTGTFLVAALALTGCSAAETGSASDDKAAAPDARSANDTGSGAEKAAAGAAGSDGSNGSKAAPPKVTANSIIRTASLTVVVKEVPKALDDARVTAENAGGYVGDETTTRDGRGHERTRLVLRVPSERYDQVLAELEGTGKVVERTAKAQDVTDQVVDVESRVKSQRASVARVRELMDQATKLSDVVALEGELSSREADLEALLAQQATLKDRTSLATITLSLSETPVKKAAKKDADPGFLDALSGGWNVLVTVVRWLALAIGAVLPFAAVLALIALVWTRGVRPRLRRGPAPATASGPAPAVSPGPAPEMASGASGGPAARPSAAPVPASRPASDPASGPAADPVSGPASGPASGGTAATKPAPPARGASSEGGEED